MRIGVKAIGCYPTFVAAGFRGVLPQVHATYRNRLLVPNANGQIVVKLEGGLAFVDKVWIGCA